MPFPIQGSADMTDRAPVRVIIDTDPGLGEPGSDIDDGFAIAMALRSPELDVRGLQSRHEAVVREPVRARTRIDPHDPQLAELTLPDLAVAVGVDERVLDLLLRVLVVRLLEAEIPLRLVEDLAPLLAGADGTLDARHSLSPPEHALDGLLVRGIDGLVLTELALRLRRLVHELPRHQTAP